MRRFPGSHGSRTVAAFLAALACACSGERADESADQSLRARVAELEAELAQRDGLVNELRADLEHERAELAQAHEERVQRETDWLDYTRAIASLELPPLPVEFQAETPEGAAEVAVEVPELAAAPDVERSAVVLRQLRMLLGMEEVRGLDLLESGLLGDGWTGPVVFRLLDGSGHLAGGLYAERLRLEKSRSARTVTLVLEEGYETRGGIQMPFDSARPEEAGTGGEGGGVPVKVRRIVLEHVDPEPWIELLPELFSAAADEVLIDDGMWSLPWVRHTLNQLLADAEPDSSTGRYRLKHLGGVFAGELRDVQLEELDRAGRVQRRLFADRLAILREETGIQLLLTDGASVRGEEKTAFLEGRQRIFLPRVDAERWVAAGVPGLAEPRH